MSDRPTKTGNTRTDQTAARQDGALPKERTAGDPVQQFLNQVARTPPPAMSGHGRGRLIFSMDATASREPSWDQACQVQGQMFLETAALGGLDVQ
ncbi:MAG: VWA domain-containing protein, partial [Geminicoccaceae bacterium]